MSDINVIKFKKLFKAFLDAMDYIRQKEPELIKDPKRYAVIKKNFQEKYENPMEAAWKKLNKSEKARFQTMYFLKKGAGEEKLQGIDMTINQFAEHFDNRQVTLIEEND